MGSRLWNSLLRPESCTVSTPVPSAPAHSEKFSRSAPRIVLALACACALLRLWRLDEWSLWYDEVLTWADLASSGGLDKLLNPLGYRIVGWTVAATTSTPEAWSLRLAPALAGIACVPVTWWAFRTWAGELRASAAALLIAVSAWHVYWSQTARFYTLAQLVALLGTGVCLRAIAGGHLVRLYLGLAVIGAASALHPSVALLVPAFALAIAWLAPWDPALARKYRRSLVLCAVLAGALIAPFAWDAFESYRGQKGQTDALASISHYLKTTGYHVSPLLLAAALCGAWFAWFARDRLGGVILVAVLLAGFAALLVATQVRVSAQYVFFLLPWIALLAAWPIKERFGLWLPVLVLPALVSCGLYFSVRQGERPQWREAYTFVERSRQADDLVFGMEATVAEFYAGAVPDELRHPRRYGVLDRWRVDELRQWARSGRDMWLVVNPEQVKAWPAGEAERFGRFLREECRLERVWPLYVESRDLSVWVYRRGQ